MLPRSLRLMRGVAGRRAVSFVTRPLQQAEKGADAAAAPKYNVDPSNPEISPSVIPWKQYKNEYYEKRGYTVAGKDWKEWADLPAPFKYLGVKVNPEHVTNHGPVWKFFSDWKTAIPATVLLSLPLWMFNWLPPVDERFELAMISIGAGWIIIGAAGPLFRSFKRSRVATKVKAMLQAEKDLNDTIASATFAFEAGSKTPEYLRTLHSAERALRAIEAAAATTKVKAAQRDAIAEQMNYLVSVANAGAADTEVAVLKAARASVESTLEKDAALQARTIDAAVKSLRDGTIAEDVITPLYVKAVEKAKADLATKPAAKPLLSANQVELFSKRFGYTVGAVDADTLKRAGSDAAAAALLVGKLGGATPALGAKYVLKAPITYVKKGAAGAQLA